MEMMLSPCDMLRQLEVGVANFLEKITEIDGDDAVAICQQATRNHEAAVKLLGMFVGDTTRTKYTSFQTEFEEFVRVVPGWSCSFSALKVLAEPLSNESNKSKFAFIKETEGEIESNSRSPQYNMGSDVSFWCALVGHVAISDINTFLVLRKQSIGNSFLQSAVLLEHYLVGLGTNLCNLAMTNASRFQTVQHNTCEKMKYYAFDARGGNALKTFQTLTNTNIRSMEGFSMVTTEERAYVHFPTLMEKVKSKPLLVCDFALYEHFRSAKDKGKYTFDQEDFDAIPSGEVPGYHSMLLIGARCTEKGYYFLLQNCWTGCYFVEVSGDYLYACGARMYYVVSDLQDINKATPSEASIGRFFESTIPDGDDERPRECAKSTEPALQ